MQIVVELLRLGDVWTLGIARNPMFFSRMVDPGVDVGNPVCATGAAGQG